MRQTSVLEWTRRLPFVPFAIHCSDGVRYEVRHPEFVVASLTDVAVGYPASGVAGPTLVTLSYYHVVRIVPLSVPPDEPSAPRS